MKKIVLCPNPYRDKDLSAAREAAEILRSVGQRTVFCLPFRPENPVGRAELVRLLKLVRENLKKELGE